jgi:hypothetical protein
VRLKLALLESILLLFIWRSSATGSTILSENSGMSNFWSIREEAICDQALVYGQVEGKYRS